MASWCPDGVPDSSPFMSFPFPSFVYVCFPDRQRRSTRACACVCMCVHVHVHVHCDLLVQFVLHVTHHHTLRRGCHAIELYRRSKRNLGFARSVKHLVKPHRILLTSIKSPSGSLAKTGELFRKANAEGCAPPHRGPQEVLF